MPITFYNPNQTATYYSSSGSAHSGIQQSSSPSPGPSEPSQDYTLKPSDEDSDDLNYHPRMTYAGLSASYSQSSLPSSLTQPSLSLPAPFSPSLPPPSSLHTLPLPLDTGDDGAFLLALQRIHEQRLNPAAEPAVATNDSSPALDSQASTPESPLPASAQSRFARARKGDTFDALDRLIPDDKADDDETMEERYGARKAKALAFLADICRSFIDQLTVATQAAHPRAGPRTRPSDPAEVVVELVNRATGAKRVISYPDEPGSNLSQPALTRWGIVLRIASLLYEAVLSDVPTTKRDIYYKDKGLFKTQSVVDTYVDDLIATAGLKRADFNLRATEKGLVASDALEIRLTTDLPLSLSASHATLIPPIERIAELDAPNGLDWILVVEKDAVFTPLCGSGLFSHPSLGPGVLVTGKGYPDLATLQLVRALADTFPNARVFGLFDADPHGLDILSVYMNGSRATRHSHDHDGLALGERMEWLGVRGSELGRLGVSYDELLPLTPTDVGKAMKMLQSDGLPADWRRELSRMLMVNRKAEIEAVSTLPGCSQGEASGPSGLVDYLVERML